MGGHPRKRQRHSCHGRSHFQPHSSLFLQAGKQKGRAGCGSRTLGPAGEASLGKAALGFGGAGDELDGASRNNALFAFCPEQKGKPGCPCKVPVIITVLASSPRIRQITPLLG